MMAAAFGSLLLAILVGLVLAALTWRGNRLSTVHVLFILCLAVGLGLGLSSCWYFLWLVLFGPPTRMLALIELAVATGLGIAFLSVNARTRRPATQSNPAAPVARLNTHPLLSLCLCFTFACGMIAFTAATVQHPHGYWDSWAIWNARARYLFRAGENWADAFSRNFVHADYPLLIPGLIARSWTYVGHDTVFVPVLVAMLFTFATAGFLGCSVALLRGRTQGVLAVLLLLGTPFLIMHGASQGADVPTGFFFLATIVLLSLYDHLGRSRSAPAVLAGVAAGLATWTKNEGWLFLGSLLAARFVAVVWLRGWKAYLRELRAFALGLLPVLAIVVYFKIQLAPSNAQLAKIQFTHAQTAKAQLAPAEAQAASHGVRAASSAGGRWFDVLQPFRNTIRDFGNNGVIYPLWLLSVYLACVGVTGGDRARLAGWTSVIVVGLMLAGYAVLYATSGPANVQAYIDNSLPRLLLQLWPSALFTYFFVASTPQEASG